MFLKKKIGLSVSAAFAGRNPVVTAGYRGRPQGASLREAEMTRCYDTVEIGITFRLKWFLNSLAALPDPTSSKNRSISFA